MDKFGIFKLLSTLTSNLNGGGNQSGNDGGEGTSLNLEDAIKNFAGAFNNLKNNSAKPKTETLSSPKHLTAPMYNAMIKHDEIVKRVMEKNK